MERRAHHLIRIMIFAALGVGVLPVIPVGEVLAPAPPEQAAPLPSRHQGPEYASSPGTGVGAEPSPIADASTLDKLRLLFSR